MKPWKGKRGRIAAGASVSLHAAVYLALAAGGFFTLFQQYTRQAGVTEVMVYNAEDLAGAGGVMRQGPMRTWAAPLTQKAGLKHQAPWLPAKLLRLILTRWEPLPMG